MNIKLNTGAEEIQQWAWQQPKHQALTISSIDKSFSLIPHRVWSPTLRRAIKEESNVANRNRVHNQACSLLPISSSNNGDTLGTGTFKPEKNFRSPEMPLLVTFSD